MKLIYIFVIIFASCSILQSNDISKSSYVSERENQLSDFRLTPYLQNPTSNSVSILWFSHKNETGEISYWSGNKKNSKTLHSFPHRAKELCYSLVDLQSDLKKRLPSPYKHRVRLSNLKGQLKYTYEVKQGKSRFSGKFSLPSYRKDTFNFVVLADTETEPESMGKHAKWGTRNDKHRKYLIDQDTGMKNNIKSIKSTNPEFIILAGDLVESGGEQRDWEEFWKHFSSLASSTYIFPAPGNHEYFAGPLPNKKFFIAYTQPYSEYAVQKYLTYFEAPENKSTKVCMKNRYYSIKYGPVSLISLDSSSGGKQGSKYDTSEFLLSNVDKNGGCSPIISPGSTQYKWMEQELKKAQINSQFTFVCFHNSPFSVGSHGRKNDKQTGYPLQFLNEIFMKHGVDAVFSGHDEMYERSFRSGIEILSDGTKRNHSIQYYDVGIGGDGLRPPFNNSNPYQKFLAYKDSPEIWKNNKLIEGGRHYGHLNVTIKKEKDFWKAILEPVYNLPIADSHGVYSTFKRKIYKDIIVLKSQE
ncbi:metallophosphoesterase [bacterium]|nr:metallophosphoesterase [bacterium]